MPMPTTPLLLLHCANSPSHSSCPLIAPYLTTIARDAPAATRLTGLCIRIHRFAVPVMTCVCDSLHGCSDGDPHFLVRLEFGSRNANKLFACTPFARRECGRITRPLSTSPITPSYERNELARTQMKLYRRGVLFF